MIVAEVFGDFSILSHMPGDFVPKSFQNELNPRKQIILT